MSLPDPGTLMAEIHASARALDAGSKRLGEAIKRLPETRAAYEREFESELIRIADAARAQGERVPAEDLRKAQAHRKVDPKVYGTYLENEAEIDALKAWLRATEAGLSARQSLLSALRAELGGGS